MVSILALTPGIAHLSLHSVVILVAAELAFVVEIRTVPMSRHNDDGGGDEDANFLVAVANKVNIAKEDKADSLGRENASIDRVDHLESRKIFSIQLGNHRNGHVRKRHFIT